MARSGSIIEAAQQHDLLEIINRGLAYAIIIAGILSVIFIFVGGISFILSGGREEKIKQALSTIRYAIIGLVITIGAVFIVSFVGRAIGLDVVKYINVNEVFQFVSDVTSGNTSSGVDSLD